MIEKHFYEILSGMVLAALSLVGYIFRADKKYRDEQHELLVNTVNEHKQKIDKQDAVIEEVKDAQRDIQVNNNEKFLGIHKELSRIEISLKNDMSTTRHTLNNNLNRMLGVIAELKDSVNDKFVTQEQHSSQIQDIKEQIRRKAV